MPLQTACTSCSVKIKVTDELIGKVVECPQCGERITMPADNSGDTVVSNPARVRAEVSDSVTDPPSVVPVVAPDANLHAAQGGLAPPDALGIDDPTFLGGYLILRKLGQGGMGAVYEAEDVKLKRHVALKVMKPEIAKHQDHRDRFLREARTAAKVESDFICRIYRVGEEFGVPFIAMPLLKGEPLDAHLKQGERLAIGEVVRIGKEVAEGLSAAHEAGLVHRDIKPANIWLETQRNGPPRAVLLDFGLARMQTDNVQITHSGVVVGTPAYMSPEQARGDTNVDARTDLFSLGCVLYALCTGELPFKGDTMMSVLTSLATIDPTPPHTLSAKIPRRLSDLIQSLLAKKPDDRPQTAREVIEKLVEIGANLANPVKLAFATQPKPPSLPTKSAGAKNREKMPRADSEMRKSKASYVLFALIAVSLLGCVVSLAGGGVYYFVVAGGKEVGPLVEGKLPPAFPEIEIKNVDKPPGPKDRDDGKPPPERVAKKPILRQGALTRESPLDDFAATRGRFHTVHLVPLESGQPYLIDLDGTFDTILRIEDADKKVLLYNDDVTPLYDLSSRLVFIPAKSATYRLVVSSFHPQATGAYTLAIQEAVKIDVATVIKGRLEKMLGGAAVHRIKLAGGNAYTLELSSPKFEASFVLTQADIPIAQAPAIPGNPARMDYTPAASGDFTVHVGRLGQEGEYALSIQAYQAPKKKPIDKKPPPVAAGDPPIYEVGQVLELRGQLGEKTPVLIYQVKLMSGKTYAIDMVSPDRIALDPFLMLMDANGQKLTDDDDSGGALNARIIFHAERTGVFRIHATSFLSRGVGPFALTVRETANPIQPKANLLRAQGQAARGAWTAAAADYAQFFAEQPLDNGERGFEYAAVLLLSGDKAGYRKICAEMLDRSGQPGFRPFHVARAFTLAPDSVKDTALAGKIAANEFKEAAKAHWALIEQGALAYRAGRYDEAALLLEQSLQGETRAGYVVVSWAWLSLVDHRRGKQADARTWLEKTTRWIEQYPLGIPLLGDEAKDLHLHGWLEAQVLRREAEALLGPKKQ